MEATDTLTLEIGPCEENTMIGGVLFLVTAVINGRALPSVLDIDEFFKALEHLDAQKKIRFPLSQRLPLLNCTCGVYECGGGYIDVTITPEALNWYIFSFLHPRPGDRRRYAFSWDNVRDVAGELLAAIYTAQAQSKNGEVRYGATGVEVTERLPFYLERYEALSAPHRFPDASR